MDLKNLAELIPNPLSNQTTPAELEQKSEILAEGLSFAGVLKNMIFLPVIGFILWAFLKLPGDLVLTLIAFEELSTLAGAYLKSLAIKSLSAITPNSEGKSLKSVLLIKENYHFLEKIVATVSSLAALGLVMAWLHPTLPTIKGHSTSFILYVFILFRAFELLVSFLQYKMVQAIHEQGNFAEVKRDYGVIKEKLKTVSFIPAASVVLLILGFAGIPVRYIFGFGAFFVLFAALSFFSIIRMSKVDLGSNAKSTTDLENLVIPPDENTLLAVFGIMNQKSTGFSFLGVGKRNRAENTLLLTNHRLAFIQVPMAGSNQIVGKTDYSSMNFFFNRGEIKQKGEELLKSSPLENVLRTCGVQEIAWEKITECSLNKMELRFSTNTNEQYKYLFMDAEYLEPLKQQLSAALKEKFTATANP